MRKEGTRRGHTVVGGRHWGTHSLDSSGYDAKIAGKPSSGLAGGNAGVEDDLVQVRPKESNVMALSANLRGGTERQSVYARCFTAKCRIQWDENPGRYRYMAQRRGGISTITIILHVCYDTIRRATNGFYHTCPHHQTTRSYYNRVTILVPCPYRYHQNHSQLQQSSDSALQELITTNQ